MRREVKPFRKNEKIAWVIGSEAQKGKESANQLAKLHADEYIEDARGTPAHPTMTAEGKQELAEV